MRVYSIFCLRRAQGRLDEDCEDLERFVSEPGDLDPQWWRAAAPLYRSFLGLAYLASSEEPGARRIYEQFAAGDFADLPRNDDWLAIMGAMALLAAAFGDETRTRVIYERLRPSADL